MVVLKVAWCGASELPITIVERDPGYTQAASALAVAPGEPAIKSQYSS